MTKTRKYTGDQIYTSLTLPNTYFNTARIIANYISKYDSPYWSNCDSNWNRDDLCKHYDDPIHEMLNPLLYNLKHWIELFCKTFLNLWKGEFEQWHDICLNYCKFKNLCLTLHIDKKIVFENEELKRFDDIEKIISDLCSTDPKNEWNRYPDANSFLICRKSKETKAEIEKHVKNDQYSQPEREWIPEDRVWSEENVLKYRYEFSLKIPNLCNQWNVWENEIKCLEKLKLIINELRDFFKNIWKKGFFSEKIKEKCN